MLDEHLSWKDHIRVVENRLQNNIGLLYRVNQYLNEASLKTVYFSYIYSYLNYANIAYAKKKIEKKTCSLHCVQPRMLAQLFNILGSTKTNSLTRNFHSFTHSIQNRNALNEYQVNIYQHLSFMHTFSNCETLEIFFDIIKSSEHNFSNLNFSET